MWWVFTRLLCFVCVGDWQAGGWKVTSTEGNSWAPKGEGQAGARPGGSSSHLQKGRLRLRVRRTAVSVHFGRHQTGAGRHQFTETLDQVADKDRKAKAEDNHPQQVSSSIVLCCCCCWVRVTAHPGSHIHSLAHTLHSQHGLHLSVCPAGHQCLCLIPRCIPPGKSSTVPEARTLRHRSSPQQQQRRPIRSLPALPNNPYSVMGGWSCLLSEKHWRLIWLNCVCFVRGHGRSIPEIHLMIAILVSQCTFMQRVHLVDLMLCTDVHIIDLVKMKMLHSLILIWNQPTSYWKRNLWNNIFIGLHAEFILWR